MIDATQFFNGTSDGGGGGAPSVHEIERSLRFNPADSAHLSRTPSVAGNRKTWTWAGWVKRSKLGSSQTLLGVYNSTLGKYTLLRFGDTDVLEVLDTFTPSTNIPRRTSAVYRDVSAWLHVALVYDTQNATANDRVRLYVNGSQITAFSILENPSQGGDSWVNSTLQHNLGQFGNATGYLSGYLADIHFIDGQALTPTSFGFFDTNGVWQPKAYTGTYGTNGFHLPFSDNSTAAALGTDTSGNGNDWTVHNLSPGGKEYSKYYTNNDVANPTYAFDPAIYSQSINTTTGVLNTTAAIGSYRFTSPWIPPAPIRITSTLDVYGGIYNNAPTPFTITVTYTDATTDTLTSSSNLNLLCERLSAAPAGKYLESISISGGQWAQLVAVRIDGTFLSDATSVDSDSLVDSPTNYGTDTGAGGEVRGNYCTWNPLRKYNNSSEIKPQNGNLDVAPSPSGYSGTISGTIAIPKTGKWYWEIGASTSTFNNIVTGVETHPQPNYAGSTNGGCMPLYYGSSAYVVPPIVVNPNGATWSKPSSATDTFGIAVDMDLGRLYLYYNGVIQNNGNYIFSGLDQIAEPLFPSMNSTNGSMSYTNFGQRPFAYPAPSGYKVLCTTNLDSETITTSGSYTGNGVADGPFVYLNGVPTAMTVNGNAVTFGTHADKLSNGFKIRTNNGTYNQNAVIYNYSITSTGDPFKTARAQSN